MDLLMTEVFSGSIKKENHFIERNPDTTGNRGNEKNKCIRRVHRDGITGRLTSQPKVDILVRIITQFLAEYKLEALK